MYRKYYDEVNRLAVIMVTTDSDEEMRRCKAEIAEIMYRNLSTFDAANSDGSLWNLDGDYVKVVFVDNPVSKDEFVDVLLEILGKKKDGQWYFNPQKGATFITYMARILNSRRKDYCDDDLKISLDSMMESPADADGAVSENTRLPEQLKTFDKYDIENQVKSVSAFSMIINRLNEEGEQCEKQLSASNKIHIRLVYDVMDFIKNRLDDMLYDDRRVRNGGKGYRMNYTEEDKKIDRDNFLHDLTTVDHVLAPQQAELDYFFRELTENCYQIYYHALKEGYSITYEYLNKYLNEYLEKMGEKPMKLDNMKKWYRKYYDDIFMKQVQYELIGKE